MEVRFADHDRACFTKSLHDSRVLGGHMIGKDSAPRRGHEIACEYVVLDSYWETMERPAIVSAGDPALRIMCSFHCRLRGHRNKGMQGGVLRLDVLNHGLRDVNRRQFTPPDQVAGRLE